MADTTTRIGVAQRVVEQIAQYLAEPFRVGPQSGEVLCDG